MDSPRITTEELLAQAVCRFFSSQHFDCKEHVLIRDYQRARFFEADILCDKEGEKNIVKIKIANQIHQNVIRELMTRMQIASLKRIRYYLCIPSYTKLSYGTRGLMVDSGIGLIIVRDGQASIQIPARLFDKALFDKARRDNLSSMSNLMSLLRVSDSPEVRMNAAEAFASYNYLVTASGPGPFTRRIARELLDKIDEMDNVAYCRLLRTFKKEYERATSRKGENDTVLRTLKKLWAGKYGKLAGARAFESFSKFEPILKAIPGYRDHLIHPFQVFLMGALIIDAHYSRFTQNYRSKIDDAVEDSLDFSWLLCSTFHDICYPVQMYESFNKAFFQDFLESETSPVVFQTERLLLLDDHLKYIDQLVSLLMHFENNNPVGSTWKYDSICRIDTKLRSIMIDELTSKNHALLSAIALLKKILTEEFVKRDLQSYLRGRFSTDIYPAALGIAMHDPKMLWKIPGSVSVSQMPLSFLLIYCDLVQECGRLEQQQETVELHSFDCRTNSIKSTLVFAYENIFKKKTTEMIKIFKKIKSTELCFGLDLRYSGSTRTEDTCNVAVPKGAR